MPNLPLLEAVKQFRDEYEREGSPHNRDTTKVHNDPNAFAIAFYLHMLEQESK